MANGLRIDPLPAFNFQVSLFESSGVLRVVAGFTECTGLESTLEAEEYREGGVNDRVYRFPTRVTFTPISLKRGVTIDPLLREWHTGFLRGRARRFDGLVVLLDEGHHPAVAWKFERGLPVKWSGPALNAGQSAAAIETLEIAHERLEPFVVTGI